MPTQFDGIMAGHLTFSHLPSVPNPETQTLIIIILASKEELINVSSHIDL